MPDIEGSHDWLGEKVPLSNEDEQLLHEVAPENGTEPEHWPGQPVHELSDADAATDPAEALRQAERVTAAEAMAIKAKHEQRAAALAADTRDSLSRSTQQFIKFNKKVNSSAGKPEWEEIYLETLHAHDQAMHTYHQYLDGKTDEENLRVALGELNDWLSTLEETIYPELKKRPRG